MMVRALLHFQPRSLSSSSLIKVDSGPWLWSLAETFEVVDLPIFSSDDETYMELRSPGGDIGYLNVRLGLIG